MLEFTMSYLIRLHLRDAAMADTDSLMRSPTSGRPMRAKKPGLLSDAVAIPSPPLSGESSPLDASSPVNRLVKGPLARVKVKPRRAMSSQAAKGHDPTTGEFLTLLDEAQSQSRPVKLSTIDRARPDVVPPVQTRLSLEQVFPLDTDKLKHHFRREGRLSNTAAFELLHQFTTLVSREKNLLELSAPLTILGDIHGQYFDLLNLFDSVDPDIPQLFLGDYVDRGYFGCEVFLYLAALKIKNPNSIFLLRGNHESEDLTKLYNFHTECIHKYNAEVYQGFIRAFESLPLAVIVTNNLEERFLCLHGGISPYFATVEDLNDEVEINRFGEVPAEGALADILWADPLYRDEEMNQEEYLEQRWERNQKRKISYTFGYGVLSSFLENNNLQSLIRAHEVKENGYDAFYYGTDVNERKYAFIYTVFSAPNYVDVYGNLSATLLIKAEGGIEPTQYRSVPHPFELPNFENGLTFSLPFLISHISGLIVGLLKVVQKAESVDNAAVEKLEAQILKLEKWNKMSAKVREERHAIYQELRFLSEAGSKDELFARAMQIDSNVEMMSPVDKPQAGSKQLRRMSSYF